MPNSPRGRTIICREVVDFPTHTTHPLLRQTRKRARTLNFAHAHHQTLQLSFKASNRQLQRGLSIAHDLVYTQGTRGRRLRYEVRGRYRVMRGLLGPDESRTRTKTRALSRVTVQERPIPTRYPVVRGDDHRARPGATLVFVALVQGGCRKIPSRYRGLSD